jgi:hypothetical protein
MGLLSMIPCNFLTVFSIDFQVALPSGAVQCFGYGGVDSATSTPNFIARGCSWPRRIWVSWVSSARKTGGCASAIILLL